MSSQHEANILGGCTEDARYIHGGYTLHPRKGTLKNGVTPCPHCGLGPAISLALLKLSLSLSQGDAIV